MSAKFKVGDEVISKYNGVCVYKIVNVHIDSIYMIAYDVQIIKGVEVEVNTHKIYYTIPEDVFLLYNGELEKLSPKEKTCLKIKQMYERKSLCAA